MSRLRSTAAVLPTLVVLAAAAGLAAVVLHQGTPTGNTVAAEFETARGLVPDAEVRVDGAVAGHVERISLTDTGRARVELALHEGLPDLGADATAAIRPVDLLGDVFVELSTGSAQEPLAGPIPVARTSNAPRLDELLSAFDAPVRAGLRAVLVEAGRSLGARGADLGRAAVELRPALEAADAVAGELGSRNAQLADLVEDAERATRGLARRPADVEQLVAGLDRVTGALDRRRAELGAGLAGLPATLRQARTTATLLGTAADAARPLAREASRLAPPLTGALLELTAFLPRLGDAARDLEPALAALRSTLAGGEPALVTLADGLSRLRGIAPELAALLDAVEPAAPKISEGFFVNFADQGAEPGRQPFDPFADPRRNYWRGAAVMSCEAFGVPVEPGCLARVLGTGRARGGGSRARRERDAPRPERPPQDPTPAAGEEDGGRPGPRPGPLPLPAQTPPLPSVPEVAGDAQEEADDAAEGLLDFLMGR